jgi:serine/threonine protein kinase
MAILQLMAHPGIARLISSFRCGLSSLTTLRLHIYIYVYTNAFRYKDAAYLVMEYAARGDLHSAIVRSGSGLRENIDVLRLDC